MNTTIGTLDISNDELLNALQAVEVTQYKEPGWFTVEELVARSSLGPTTVRRRLRALAKAGRVEFKDVVRISMLGARYHCNAFHTVK